MGCHVTNPGFKVTKSHRRLITSSVLSFLFYKMVSASVFGHTFVGLRVRVKETRNCCAMMVFCFVLSKWSHIDTLQHPLVLLRVLFLSGGDAGDRAPAHTCKCFIWWLKILKCSAFQRWCLCISVLVVTGVGADDADPTSRARHLSEFL